MSKARNKFISKNIQDTENFAKEFGKRIEKGDVVCLYGELGAGKTQFTKGVAQGLGISRIIKSVNNKPNIKMLAIMKDFKTNFFSSIVLLYFIFLVNITIYVIKMDNIIRIAMIIVIPK